MSSRRCVRYNRVLNDFARSIYQVRPLPLKLRGRFQRKVPRPYVLVFNMDRSQPTTELTSVRELTEWLEFGPVHEQREGKEGPPIISEFVEILIEGVDTSRIKGNFDLALDVVSEANDVRTSITFPAFHSGGICDNCDGIHDYAFSQILPAKTFLPGDRLYFRFYVPPVRTGSKQPEVLLTDFGTPTASIRLLMH